MNKNKSDPIIKKRAFSILQHFNLLLDKLKLDPITETFRQNESLKDFYIKRVIEKIQEFLNDEKENYIETLLSENKNLKSNNIEKTNELNTLKDTIIELNQLLNLKENKIGSLNNLNEKLSLDFQEISQRIESLNTEYKNFKSLHDNILNENDILRKKIKLLEDDNIIQNQQISDLNFSINNLQKEIRIKEDHLNFFKDAINKMKTRQDELVITVQNIVKENENLKIEIVNKTETNEEMIKKIEEMRIEQEEKNKEYLNIRENLNKLNQQIEMVYKVKIKALKNKLKEKVEVLVKREEEIKRILNSCTDSDRF